MPGTGVATLQSAALLSALQSGLVEGPDVCAGHSLCDAPFLSVSVECVMVQPEEGCEGLALFLCLAVLCGEELGKNRCQTFLRDYAASVIRVMPKARIFCTFRATPTRNVAYV
jgi:hypothetical protein